MRVRGPSLTTLDARADAAGELLRRQLTWTAMNTAGKYSTLDDVNIVRTTWTIVVDAFLLTAVEQAWWESANDVRAQLNSGVVRVAAPLQFTRVVSQVAELFLASARSRLVAIGDVLWASMREQLLTGFQLGESVGEMRDRIIETANIAAPRAETIVRTEVIGASNAGSFYQMKATGLRATKEWLAVNDDRTRSSHRAVDGTVIDMDEKFMVGGWPLDFPHDPLAPPEETINCRCTLAWDILSDDMSELDLPLVADAFHLLGQHDQSDHGNRRNQKSRDSSNTSNDSQDDFDTRIAKAYVDSDVFTHGSQYSSLSDFAKGYEASRGEGDPTTSRVEGAFGLYQTNYESINAGLRTGDLDDFDERVVGYMNAGLERSATTSDVVVHRGISDPKKLFGDAWDENGDNSGLTWVDPAYMSTTTSVIVARSYATTDLIKRNGVMMRLLVKSGTPSMPMRGNLSQLLLGAGRTSKITRDYVGEDGFRTIDVEVS